MNPTPFLDAIVPFRTITTRDIPPDALTVARQCTLDWLGCALAGSAEPLSQILRAELLRNEALGDATVVGAAARASARTAALLNGAAGHALDFDDTHLAMSGHPTAPILPAVLALAEELDASAEALLAAFVAGVEVACRLGSYIGAEHYRLGFHATGTLGTIGAAAACANLLHLDDPAWRSAISLAGTQSAGLKASFGSMAKPLHAGKAASDGLFAARLAAGGYTGAADIIDAPVGLAAAAANGKTNPAALEASRDHFLIRDTLFKYHASCYLTHAGINAISSLRGQFEPAAITAIELRVHPSLFTVCNIQQPRSGLEVKFSLRATAAMAALGLDTTNAAMFADALAQNPALVTLRDRVAVVADSSLASSVAHVTISTHDGCTLAAVADTGVPAADLTLQASRLQAKFLGLATPALGADVTAQLSTALLNMDAATPVRAITQLAVRPAFGPK